MKLCLRSLSRFSLRTLFVVVTVLAVGLGYLVHEWRIVKLRREVLEWAERSFPPTLYYQLDGKSGAAIIEEREEPPWLRRMLGDTSFLLFGNGFADDDLAQIRNAFPRARITKAPE